jgi:phosphoenolpyruvate phosphomutase
VDIKKGKIKNIVYSFVVGDLFHYGHLNLLKTANSLGDLHVCGVLTDNAVASYKRKPITTLKERKAIVSSLDCVDMVMSQNSRDPTENLKKIHEEFSNAKLILVHGSDWKKVPGEDFIKKIKGKLVKPPYYERLSTSKIINTIIRRYKGKNKKGGTKK